MTRRSIEIESLKHSNPIPSASRVGPLIESSITPPFNPGTRDIPETLEAQIDNLFIHVGNMLTEAGASWDDMVKMTFYVVDPGESRKALNGPWEKLFPDPESRPARHNLQVPAAGPVKISTTFTAYVE
jgi:enamine deaminase RidA (YjgF/YER057c/UK114 family)